MVSSNEYTQPAQRCADLAITLRSHAIRRAHEACSGVRGAEPSATSCWTAPPTTGSARLRRLAAGNLSALGDTALAVAGSPCVFLWPGAVQPTVVVSRWASQGFFCAARCATGCSESGVPLTRISASLFGSSPRPRRGFFCGRAVKMQRACRSLSRDAWSAHHFLGSGAATLPPP